MSGRKLLSKQKRFNEKLPADQRDAFFELVLYPVKAAAIVNELYITAGKNHLYASRGAPVRTRWRIVRANFSKRMRSSLPNTTTNWQAANGTT